MSVRIQLTSIIPQVTERARWLAGAVVRKAAMDILTTASASMEGPKSGRVYSVGGKAHTASAPGESPAVDTGNLRASGYAQWRNALEAEVGYSAEYAEMLEGAGGQFAEGGLLDMAEAMGVWMAPSRGELAPRPFLRPAVEAEADAFYAAMRKVAG